MKQFQIMRLVVIWVLALDLFLGLSMILGPQLCSSGSTTFVMPGIAVTHHLSRGFSIDRFNPVVFFPIILALFVLVWCLFGLSAPQEKKYKHMLVWLGLGIGLLILIVVIMSRSGMRPGQVQRLATLVSIEKLEHSISCFAEDCRRPPTIQEGLDALQTNPGNSRWRGPYYTRPVIPSQPRLGIDRIPLDSWGHNFGYTNIHGRFTVVSAGPDGVFDTADDIHGK